MRTLLIIAVVLLAQTSSYSQDLGEKRRENVLGDGTKILSISRPHEQSSERYQYKPDGSFQKHVAQEFHPDGRIVCRRSYDSEQRLLAFQTFAYDRDWKLRAVRTFNAAGHLVLYGVSGAGADDPSIIYTSEAPDRKRVDPFSLEYAKIVAENHLEAFQ